MVLITLIEDLQLYIWKKEQKFWEEQIYDAYRLSNVSVNVVNLEGTVSKYTIYIFFIFNQ